MSQAYQIPLMICRIAIFQMNQKLCQWLKESWKGIEHAQLLKVQKLGQH